MTTPVNLTSTLCSAWCQIPRQVNHDEERGTK